MKKIISAMGAISLAISTLSGCAGSEAGITVISREDGSGTRSAFVELLDILDENGIDAVTPYAEVTNSTSVMLATVSGNRNAIGYVSLGSLSTSVKALAVDGVMPGVDTVKDGSYRLARPFILAATEDLSAAAEDFVSYILSAEGQAIITENGYIGVNDSAEAYSGGNRSGSITVSGSTSVAPVMEKLAHSYMELNPDVSIEIQQPGSGAGITAAIEGVCDIAMSSRELSESELAQGLYSTTMAKDGIAVIVNHENSLEGLSAEQVRSIFLGEITDWGEL